ncbi:MAG: glycosyltransferase family 4 protein [Rubrivivax sp.]|nr:glycosyltransferase family 4 protein [Rubrivivax sp.]
MNILYLNHYAGSPALGMEYRPYYLAREWVRLGHRVRMVAADYSHVRTRQPKAGDETIDEIDYHWVHTPPYRGNGPARARNVWRFLSTVWREAPQLVREQPPQVVIASSTYPMDIWVARRLARLAGARLVYEVHDLWPLSPRELFGMPRWHPFIVLCQAAEDTAYRDADAVVSMLPKVHDYMASRGLDLRKLAIVPNGITLDEWQGEPEPIGPALRHVLQKARAQGRTVVGYAGSHGMPNALDTLLDAAARLRDEPFTFVLVGDGHEKQRLAARVQAEGLTQVDLLPAIPKAQVPSFLAEIDIAYIGWQRVPLYRFGIAPNKLMDYMMAGCTVLHSVEAGNDPVVEAGCGVTVPPEDPAAVAEGLRRLAATPEDDREAMGRRGQAFVLANHTYPVLAERFLQACGVPA